MEAKIEVLESPTDLKVIATFDDTDELIEWNKTHNVNADQIVVNGNFLYRWTELFYFI